MNLSEEKDLFRKIKQGDERAFEKIFLRYYQNLCVYASKILKDEMAAEEIVQDLFVNIWEKHQALNIKTSPKNYLVRAVKNHCLNFIKHTEIKRHHAKNVVSQMEKGDQEENFIEVDLMKKIEESINSLPKKRQEVFRLSREEGLKYREIAEKLNVSIKTVETQMGLAIKTLREKLKNYHTFITLFYLLLKK